MLDKGLQSRSCGAACATACVAVAVTALLLTGLPVGASGESYLTLQTGRTAVTKWGATTYYNDTLETSITQQYIESWNNMNGMTYFWGSTGSDEFKYTLSDVRSEGGADFTRYRTLLRFSSLEAYVPDGAQVLSAEMTLSFLNWGPATTVQGCFMTRPWQHQQISRFQGTGWRYSQYVNWASQEWTQPGGWADCSPNANIQFTVPSNGAYGMVTLTIALDPGLVQGWVQGGGAGNFGLLFRAIDGSISFVTSQYQKDPSKRPVLTLSYSTDYGAAPAPVAYPVQLGAIPRTWWVSPSGDDELNTGHAGLPFKTPYKAVFEALPGDRVYLLSGVYPGSFSVTRPRITIQSAPGHWAVIAAPLNDPIGSVNVLTLRPGADYGVLRNLEVTGGFYYGIMFFTSWENYGPMADRVAQGAGPNHWLIENVRIHDTGSSGVKMSMKPINTTFRNCEIYNTGARLRTGGHGIEAVQVYGLTVEDCYIHDTPAAGVHLAGGTSDAVVRRSYITRTGFGINMGFATNGEYMDMINNPGLYECIRCTAVNNIIAQVSMAGVNVWAARDSVVAHNTFWQAQERAQAGVILASYLHDYLPNGQAPVLTSCANVVVRANVFVKSPTARVGPVFQIRAAGLAVGSPLVMAHNVYYDSKGLSNPAAGFVWGHGAMLEDERATSPFIGNPAGWSAFCSGTLGQPQCDIGSLEANPQLDALFTPQYCSPARLLAAESLAGVVVATDDFHGRQRPAGQRDAGAVDSGAWGPTKPFPPVPSAFASFPAYTGLAPPPAFDKQWPFDTWRTRQCRDLYVDAVNGADKQKQNWESNYAKPFRTLQRAITNANMCDRILLKGGQVHLGPAGIFRPNLTIMTNPADGARAVLSCTDAGEQNCLRMGDGDLGGAAAITLQGFDIQMAGAGTGDCLRLNEGGGSGTSAYWAWYLAAAGLSATGRRTTVIKDMVLSNCRGNGIKLSTFVHDVLIDGITIVSPTQAGIEVRGGWDLTIRNSNIQSPGETGIRLAGGARNCLVEKNMISNAGGRGLLLGSDVTEVMYMDVDYARMQDPEYHDCINATLRNNLVLGAKGAGMAFYSARDAFVAHNTFVGVASEMQAGVLLNVSPKRLSPYLETGPANTNIVFENNIVTLPGGGTTSLMVEARIMQGSEANTQLPANLPAPVCPAHRLSQRHLHHHLHRHTHLRSLRGTASMIDDHGAYSAMDAGHSVDAAPATGAPTGDEVALGGGGRQLLQAGSFAQAFMNTPGEQGRNADGSCPMFPSDNYWYQDVTGLPVHPNSQDIKYAIGGGGMHADFGDGFYPDSSGQRVLYGIPFRVVDSSTGNPSLVPIDIGPSGYPGESDVSPSGFPFPPDTPVEGAYMYCPEPPCGGDRHVLIIDQATCTLYETWRSFPPGQRGALWQADIIATFNLSRNAVGRPLGWSSADAAGLPIRPGLVTYNEAVINGAINHAIRFTGPNSRAAYSPPASHFAPAGDSTDPYAPWMGMRIRLAAAFDCSTLSYPVSKVFCEALKKYGGIFADNGSPWFFSGEATAAWDPYLAALGDISKIPASMIEVLDTGCLCLDAPCSVVDCGSGTQQAGSIPVYAAVADASTLHFSHNLYYRPGGGARYVDRRVGYLGQGYDGGLAGWQAFTNGGDSGSFEADPQLSGFSPLPSSPARGAAPLLAQVADDYYGRSRAASGNGATTDAGAVIYT